MRAPRTPFPLLLAAWVLAALTLALHRTPYDDEWYSLELATRTDWAQFWRSVRNDRHPSWVALLDRGVVALGGGRVALHGVRVGITASAITLVSRIVRQRLGLPAWSVALAAFHPVVLMYGGALRWYPFFFFGQALCATALWRRAPGSPGNLLILAAGGLVLSASSYLGPLFFALHATWAWAAERRSGAGKGRPRRVVLLALGTVLLPHLLSPLGPSRLLSHAVVHGSLPWLPSSTLGWALGPAGEAHPPVPWLLAAAFTHVATVFAWLRMRRRDQALASWLLTVALLWLLCTFAGVWHPRYSMGLWLWTTAAWGLLVSAGLAGRGLLVAGASYLCVGLVLITQGRGTFKAGLLELEPSDCQRLLGGNDHDLLVASYARIAALLRNTCRPTAPILHLALPQHVEGPAQQLERLRDELAERDVRSVRVVRRAHAPSQLRVNHQRAEDVLGESGCEPAGQSLAVPLSHGELRSALRPGPAGHYLVSERWECGQDDSRTGR